MNDISQIVAKFSDDVFRLVRRIVNDRDQALDLTQETFVRVLCTSCRPVEHAALRAYVLRAAYNVALNFKRDHSRHSARMEIYGKEYSGVGEASPDTVYQQKETAARVSRALESLPQKQREVLSLRFFGELTMAEIAAAMRIKEGSVKVHLSRGLNKLRELTKTILSEETL